VRRANIEIRLTAPAESEVIIAVSGELDMSTIDALTDQVETELRRPIELNYQARQESWRLRLIFPRHESAARVLQITGADVALPFERQSMW
jgi:hypothetical protein